jgi:protoheme IX farnesyltransferase
LTKFGIVTFVIFTATGGYLIGQPFIEMKSHMLNLFTTLLGLYFLSSGSFALNQYQECDIDARMPRTKNRPIPAGRITKEEALVLADVFAHLRHCLLSLYVSWKVALLGLTTVILYNYFYTLKWKRKSPFAAIPGAIPGAMPFVIGYTAASNIVFDWTNLYFFSGDVLLADATLLGLGPCATKMIMPKVGFLYCQPPEVCVPPNTMWGFTPLLIWRWLSRLLLWFLWAGLIY